MRKDVIKIVNNDNPRVGVAVIVEKDGKILLGLRKSEWGKNTWGLPGGKLDFGEDLKHCAIREMYEETNLYSNSDDLILAGVSNSVYEQTHYVSIIYKVGSYVNHLMVKESDKCEKWEWFDYDNLPENLFLLFKNFVLSGGLANLIIK